MTSSSFVVNEGLQRRGYLQRFDFRSSKPFHAYKGHVDDAITGDKRSQEHLIQIRLHDQFQPIKTFSQFSQSDRKQTSKGKSLYVVRHAAAHGEQSVGT